MLKKSLVTVLLMGLALSASAEGPVAGVETQKLHFTLGMLPSESMQSQFYCDVGPTVSFVSFTFSDTTVNGYSDITFSSTSIISKILNQEYFTASVYSLTGGIPTIDVEYEGSKDDMACYSGTGNRTIEYMGSSLR